MNIKEAKEEIANTLRAYHRKDENGEYCFPLLRQRPILLMGPPGIGKTAIMEQIAQECGVGLVAYTITHHTRQSAVGLPRIEERIYEEKAVRVTEYTMSEIIASVYDCMKQTGKKEGILFIDEINCVSETLAPTMLQFLQSKTFGSHKVPEGWMIVAAGNPPEYNKSVREFDIVTLDRVRKMEIFADCDVWMEYAQKNGVHQAILSFLGLRPEQFYKVENTADGKFFVTARGWEDLSEILKNYEELEVPVTENLIVQYLQREEVARSFFVYYQLYCKYGEDYGISEILEGDFFKADYEKKVEMASHGGFEERFTVVNLILAGLQDYLRKYCQMDRYVSELHQVLRHFQEELKEDSTLAMLEEFAKVRRNALEVKMEAELISLSQIRKEKWLLGRLETYLLTLKQEHYLDMKNGFERMKELFSEELHERAQKAEKTRLAMDRAFAFIEESFGNGQEMILFVSALARDEKAVSYFTYHECESFLKYSEVLLYKKQEKKLLEECGELLEEV